MTYGAPSFWTNEKVEILTELWAEGQTAQHIAGVIRAKSRNAIIGKVHRLGLVQGEKTPDAERLRKVAKARGLERRREAVERREQRMKKPVKPKTASAPSKRPQPPTILPPLPIIDAPVTPHCGAPDAIRALTDHQCRFPIGEPSKPDFHFCTNERSSVIIPYCPDHMAIAYQQNQKQAKKAERSYGPRHRGGEMA